MNRRGLIIGSGVLAVAGGGVAAAFAGIGSSEDYAKVIARQRAPLSVGADQREIVRFAALAANGHNTQPWRLWLDSTRITTLPDLTRRTPAVDPDDHHIYVSLGCAAENMAIAAAARGFNGEPVFDPDGDGAVVFEHAPAAPAGRGGHRGVTLAPQSATVSAAGRGV
jgi:hypothetical protein